MIKRNAAGCNNLRDERKHCLHPANKLLVIIYSKISELFFNKPYIYLK